MSPKQQLQKDRAYFKFVLSGLPKPVQRRSLTDYEQNRWEAIIRLRTELMKNWDKNSVKLGLNLSNRKPKFTYEF